MKKPSVFIQWKGTDVCMDFTCTCGFPGHFDGLCAYYVRCPQCKKVWKMPDHMEPVEPESDYDPNVSTPVELE